MADELAQVLHAAARDSLVTQLVDDEDAGLSTKSPLDVQKAREGAEFCVTYLKFGQRMALAVEMASLLADLDRYGVIAPSAVSELLQRWREVWS